MTTAASNLADDIADMLAITTSAHAALDERGVPAADEREPHADWLANLDTRRRHPGRQIAARPSDMANRHLACDCGWTVRLDAGAVGESLARHTLVAHRRAPTTTERTPRHTVNQPQEHT